VVTKATRSPPETIKKNVRVLKEVSRSRRELEEAIVQVIPILRKNKVVPTQGNISRALGEDAFRVRQTLRRLRRAQKVFFKLEEVQPNRMHRVYYAKRPKQGQVNSNTEPPR